MNKKRDPLLRIPQRIINLTMIILLSIIHLVWLERKQIMY